MIRFRSTEPSERARIAGFLQKVFNLDPDSPVLDPATLDWKYYGPHPLWEDASRSYVVQRDGEYLSHGCASPISFWEGQQEIRGFHMADWASSGVVPGAGTFLYRSLLSRAGVLLSIGGSEDAQRILPHFRFFRKVESTSMYGLPLRPLRQVLRSHKNYKSPARLIRNWIWSQRRNRNTSGWFCDPVSAPAVDWPFDTWIEPLLASGIVPLRRSVEWLRYLLRCPSAPLSVFSLRQNGCLRGYAAVSVVLNQARIVDLLIGSASQLDWSRALSSLTACIEQMHTVDEIFSRTSLPLFANALLDTGFVARGEQVVYVADPARKCGGMKLETNCMIGDQMYLPTPENPYLT